MPIQDRLTQVGVAKQSGKGTFGANPTYQLGVTDGNVVVVELTQEDLNPTWSSRVVEAQERKLVVPGSEFGFIGMPKTLGVFLLGALGTNTVTGTGPYTHTFKTGDDLPYITVWTRKGSTYHRVKDQKVDSFELSFEAGAALRCKAKFMGLDIEFLAGAYTATTDERPAVDGFLRASGGTFQVDGASVKVVSGTVKFNNGLELVRDATKVNPDDVFPTMSRVEVDLTVVPDDLLTFRKVVTGAVGGSTISNDPLSGSCSLKWVKDANNDLTVAVNKFVYTSPYPETKAEGGPTEVKITGVGVAPAAGDAFTAVLRNSVASY